jgi:hypothetical protein
MIGYHFIITQGNALTGRGVIIQKLANEKYLCKMLGQLKNSRIMSLDQLSAHILFENVGECDAFIKANTQPTGTSAVTSDKTINGTGEQLPEGASDGKKDTDDHTNEPDKLQENDKDLND